MYEIYSICFFSLSFSIFHFISSVHFYYFHTCRCNVRQAQTDCPDRQKAKSNLTSKCRARNNSDFLFESVRDEVMLTVWWIRSFFTSNRIWLPNTFTFDWFLWVIINNVIGDNVFSVEYKIRDLNNEFPKKLAISIWMINILGFLGDTMIQWQHVVGEISKTTLVGRFAVQNLTHFCNPVAILSLLSNLWQTNMILYLQMTSQ